MPDLMRILIARHPETEANVSGRFVGRGHSPYTTTGEAQVERIVDAVVAFRPDAVWSSPSDRARIPAERAAERIGVPHILDDRLVEMHFGQAEGLTFEEIQAAGMNFEYRNALEPVAPGGESRAQIEARAAEVADTVVASGGRIAVVTHGGVMRAMLVHLLGLASSDIWAFHLKNAQLADVTVGDEGYGWLEEFRQA